MNKRGFHPTQHVSQQFYPYPPPTYSPPHMYAQNNVPEQRPTHRQTGDKQMLPMEQSSIENIVRMNRGKHVTIHMTFSKNPQTFTGIIETAGRDHIILSDQDSSKRYLLLMVYVDYIVFDEEIDYTFPLGNSGPLPTSPPR